MAEGGGKEYNMCGVPVQMPAGLKPFPSQLAVMSKCIAALRNGHNALLESPTGTGKTLALLASALSWQRKERQERWQAAVDAAVAEAIREAPEDAPAAFRRRRRRLRLPPVPKVFFASRTHSQLAQSVKELRRCSHYHSATLTASASVPASGSTTPSPPSTSAAPAPPLQSFAYSGGEEATSQPGPSGAPPPAPPPAPREPTTVHADRTVALRMTVLGSREQYCVHRTVSKSKAKEEDCRTAVAAGKCGHYPGAQALRKGLPPVWDIEEAVSRSRAAGRHRGGCPYFASKAALDTADIVLCPYTYLVDPAVRGAMGIDVGGAVVILDEAHNIEGVAREAASLRLSLHSVEGAVSALRHAATAGFASQLATTVAAPLEAMGEWLRTQSTAMGVAPPPPLTETEAGTVGVHRGGRRGGGRRGGARGGRGGDTPAMAAARDKHRVLTIPESLRQLEEGWGLAGPALEGWVVAADELSRIVQEAVSEQAEEGGGGEGSYLRTLAKSVQSVVEAVNRTLVFWLRASEGAFRRDFRLAITFDSALDGHGNASPTPFLEVWCLSAKAAMADLARKAHSIVLTSGTLAPLDSFAAELGVPFPVRLEAAHVIQLGQQLFAAVLPHAIRKAPGGGTDIGTGLKAVYSSTQTTTYRDGLGVSLLTLARAMPGGMLVFLPSYALLHRCRERWQETGLWEELGSVKPVFHEPRGGGKSGDDFDSALAGYRAAVVAHTPLRMTAAYGAQSGTPPGAPDQPLPRGWAHTDGPCAGAAGPHTRCPNGALFLAVCRGKVSEGIDFADEFARCVVLVGIPYPSFKDPQVVAKRAFQDTAAARAVAAQRSTPSPSEGVLTPQDGSAWYAQQAFRALNQALGRCIRHRNDFGAVVLVDPRFNEERTLSSLSRWFRGAVRRGMKGGEVLAELEAFARQVPDVVAARIAAQAAPPTPPAPAPVPSGAAVAAGGGGMPPPPASDVVTSSQFPYTLPGATALSAAAGFGGVTSHTLTQHRSQPGTQNTSPNTSRTSSVPKSVKAGTPPTQVASAPPPRPTEAPPPSPSVYASVDTGMGDGGVGGLSLTSRLASQEVSSHCTTFLETGSLLGLSSDSDSDSIASAEVAVSLPPPRLTTVPVARHAFPDVLPPHAKRARTMH